MERITEIFLRLLDKDIKAKNAFGIFVGLLAAAITYTFFRHNPLFEELKEIGASIYCGAFFVVFLLFFMGAWLFFPVITLLAKKYTAKRKEQQEEERMNEVIESLTDWQWQFIMRFCVEDKRQIRDFEIGGYQSAWGPEVDVLIKKGLIIKYFGMYEINNKYLRYLKEKTDRENR